MEWRSLGQEGEKKPDQTEAAAKGEDNGMGIVEMEEEDPLVAVCMVSKWKGERNEVLMATAEGKKRRVISRGRSVAVGPWNPNRLSFSILDTTLKKCSPFREGWRGRPLSKAFLSTRVFTNCVPWGIKGTLTMMTESPLPPLHQFFKSFLSFSLCHPLFPSDGKRGSYCLLPLHSPSYSLFLSPGK